MVSRLRNLSIGVERLENRELMAADISVVRGDLYIKGTSAGEIAIVDLGDGTLQITEKGAAEDGSDIVTVKSGVTDDIFIRLDGDGSATSDVVTLDLTKGSVAVDQVFAALGEGDNSFSILGGTIGGTVAYSGRSGVDSLSVAAGVVIQGNLFASLGNGENSMKMEGTIDRSLGVRGGADGDSITLGSDSLVSGKTLILAGDGDNKIDIGGELQKGIWIQAGSGDDTLTLSETSLVEGSVVAQLGDGANSATVDGIIDGNLRIVSLNAEDEFVVSDSAVVMGDTLLGAGEQFSGRKRFRVGMSVPHSHRLG